MNETDKPIWDVRVWVLLERVRDMDKQLHRMLFWTFLMAAAQALMGATLLVMVWP
jgi:hypothetical protein